MDCFFRIFVIVIGVLLKSRPDLRGLELGLAIAERQ